MAEQSSFEVEGPGGIKAKGKGPWAVGIILAAAIIFCTIYFGKDVLAMSEEHKALSKSVDKVEKAQQKTVQILSRQTELFKLQLELQALPVAQRKQFLKIYKNSPTWKGKPDGG